MKQYILFYFSIDTGETSDTFPFVTWLTTASINVQMLPWKQLMWGVPKNLVLYANKNKRIGDGIAYNYVDIMEDLCWRKRWVPFSGQTYQSMLFFIVFLFELCCCLLFIDTCFAN